MFDSQNLQSYHNLVVWLFELCFFAAAPPSQARSVIRALREVLRVALKVTVLSVQTTQAGKPRLVYPANKAFLSYTFRAMAPRNVTKSFNFSSTSCSAGPFCAAVLAASCYAYVMPIKRSIFKVVICRSIVYSPASDILVTD